MMAKGAGARHFGGVVDNEQDQQSSGDAPLGSYTQPSPDGFRLEDLMGTGLKSRALQAAIVIVLALIVCVFFLIDDSH
jgi:hypothetical protein